MQAISKEGLNGFTRGVGVAPVVVGADPGFASTGVLGTVFKLDAATLTCHDPGVFGPAACVAPCALALRGTLLL
jgi:hypothetical protein